MREIFIFSMNTFLKYFFTRIVKAQVIVEGGDCLSLWLQRNLLALHISYSRALHVCSEVLIAHAQEQYAWCIQSKTTMHPMLT